MTPDSMESKMDRAASRNGASTLSPVSEDVSRKWTSVTSQPENSFSRRTNPYYVLLPICSPLPIPPVGPLLDLTCSRPGQRRGAGSPVLSHPPATLTDLRMSHDYRKQSAPLILHGDDRGLLRDVIY